MKNRLIGLLLALVFAFAFAANAQGATIKDGTILYQPGSYMAGNPIPLGVDQYGYNYQAHMFSGSYFNAYANRSKFPPYDGDDTAYLAANPTAAGHWAWPYRHDEVAMKWNDAWLSNKDLNNDTKLDKPIDDIPNWVFGSGAWINNHQSGKYLDDDGNEQVWNYFIKIVAVPKDAQRVPDADTYEGFMWVAASGKEIGQQIWGSFAVILEVYNNSGTGDHGVLSRGASPGLGKY